PTAGRVLSIPAYGGAAGVRFPLGKRVETVGGGVRARVGAWRFLGVVGDPRPRMGGGNPRLRVGGVRQFPPIARREIGVRHGTRSKPRTADQRLEEVLGGGRSRRG